MATNIFNFDGTTLTTVADGTLDQTHASIKIPGRGYQSYGRDVMEGMIWIMQNFAGTTAPPYPSVGQLWYDKTVGASILKVWTGAEWVSAGGVIAADTAPATGSNQGALWYDTKNKQLNSWDGDVWDLVGPLGSKINADPLDPAVPVNSTVEAMTVIAQEDGLPRQVWRISVGGTMLAVLSKDQVFTPQSSVLTSNGFTTIHPGINFNSTIANVGLSGDNTIFKGTQTNLPVSDAVYDLGSSSKRLNNIYSANGIFSSGLGVNTTPSQFAFEVNGTSKFDDLVTFGPGTANHAPTKWTQGNLLTNPQIGAVEFDGNNFYFTGLLNGIPTRQQPVFNANTINSSTLYVSTHGNDGNDGRSRTSPYKTINKALNYIKNNSLSGYTIFVESGDYLEQNPMYVPPRISIVGDNLRRVIVRPVHNQLDLFHVDVGTFFFGMTFKDHRAPAFCFAFPCSTATAVIGADPANTDEYRTLTQIKPTYSQSGYDAANPPDVFIEAPSYSAGRQATAKPNIVNGAITDITISVAGSGYNYSSPPLIQITGANGSGTGAIATARVSDDNSGLLLAIDITDPGQDYVAPISVSISGSGGASAVASVGDGVIRSYTILDEGSGYTRSPWVSVKGVNPPVITSSPYVQNCSSITGPFDTALAGVSAGGRLITGVPLPYPVDAATPAGSGYGSVDPEGAGAGIRIDGEVVNNDEVGGTVIRSFVADSFTQLNQGGIGHLIINRGYAQFVSCFTTFSSVGYWARSGGFANISNSVIDFGNYGLKAEGYYPTAYTTGTMDQTYTSGIAVVKITSGGTGYTTNFDVTFSNKDSGGNTIWNGGTRATGTAVVENGAVTSVRINSGGALNSGYTGVPVIDFSLGSGTGVVGTAVLASWSSIRVNGTTYKPQVGSAMLFSGTFYTVSHVENGDGLGGWDVTLNPALVSANNAAMTYFHDISNISTGGLALEYVGSGVTYNALPRYGGNPDSAAQVVDKNTDASLTPGVVYYVTISNDGNFNVGPYFSVNFVDGSVKLNSDSFKLTGIAGIGPFKRYGVFVGTFTDEISNDPTLTHLSNTTWDKTTIPTQEAVRGYFGRVNSDILPKNNNTSALGNSSYRWQSVNSNLITASTGTVATLASTTATISAATISTATITTATASTLNATTGTFTGDVSIAGKLKVTGDTITFNSSTLTVADPIISIGTAANNAVLSADDGFDRGLVMHHYNTTATGSESQGDNHSFLGRTHQSVGLYGTGSLVYINNITPGVETIPTTIPIPGAVGSTTSWGNVIVGSATFNGDINATGDIIGFYLSDQRLKTNMEPITDALAKVNSLHGITFDWNETAKESRPHRNKREAGIIAQEVEMVMPEIVNIRTDGYKAVDYDKLVPLLIEAIKELTAKVDRLEKNK